MEKIVIYAFLGLTLLFTVNAYKQHFTDGEIKAVYIGCYRDDRGESEGDRALCIVPGRDGKGEKFDEGNVQQCLRLCWAKKTRYAGVQNGDLCFCGTSYDKYGRLDDSECNMPCRAAGQEREERKVHYMESCGGRWANAVWSLNGDPFMRNKIPRPEEEEEQGDDNDDEEEDN